MAALVATAAWTGQGVRIAEVASALRELRAESGDDLSSTLTSVMNLVAFAPDEPSARDVEAIADALRDYHPSRVVIVVPTDGADRIDARAEVMSRARRGSDRTLVVEQIILHLRGAIATHAGSAVISLLRSQLPTFLWWPTAPDPSSPAFVDLLRISDRLVTETGRALRGRAALECLTAVTASSPTPVTDLAWAVLTPWRQIMATSLRGEALFRLRVGVATATITTRAGAPTLEALLLAGWLVDIVGEHIAVRFAEARGDDDIRGVTLLAADECVLELAREDRPSTVTMRTAIGGPRVLPIPPTNRTELLAGELEIRGHDKPFERALNRGRALLTR